MNRNRITEDENNRAAIVLAGGEGTRLAGMTRRADGVHVPKQFCALIGEAPLLDQTRRRLTLSIAADRISFVLNKDHERFFSPLLADVPQKNLVVQPQNRGTAPAILYSLLRLADTAPRASVLLTPSDHHVGDEAALMKCVDKAFSAVEERSELTVLLGVTAVEPEIGYGWIEPGMPLGVGQREIRPVRRFWEKPSYELARDLMARDCLWSTLMVVGRLTTLLGLFILAMPELYIQFSRIRRNMRTAFERETVRRLYEGLPTSDFSRDVLQPVAANLSVLQVSDTGWSDLGEPHRVAKALAGRGAQQKDVAA